MSKREEGFYWIKTADSDEWKVADYFRETWQIFGSEIIFDESKGSWFSIEIIDAVRIHPPAS